MMKKTKIPKKFYFTEIPFNELMRKRIHKVLLVCSTYDAFILEEDGRIDEQIFNEYVSLNLRYPPQFYQVSSAEQAFETLENENIDLVITMLRVEGMDPFVLAKQVRRKYEEVPIVVLTPFSREVSMKLRNEDLSAIDYVFCWLGNADLLLAIIKLIEDKMNAEHDVFKVGVQTILLVEDSVRFYSSYLPNIYKIIFNQSLGFMSEGLNEHEKMLRMRGRPKILLATNYEDALQKYEKFKYNLLGVITDVQYPRGGVSDKTAGYELSRRIKKDSPLMPVLMQSSNAASSKMAKQLKVGFLYKYSKKLSLELKRFINQYFAFGDFVFVKPESSEELFRVPDLKTLQQKLFQVPEASLEYHLRRNHFSKWLTARALFPLADLFRYVSVDDFQSLDHIRSFLFDTISHFRMNKGRGIIAKFYRESFDEYLTFTRIGEGSIGGKARGLAFIDSIIKKHWALDKFKNVLISIPRTVVLSTEVFDEFMETNNLHSIALSDASDDEILCAFIDSHLPYRIHQDLLALISVISNPIAIRSSSLLEDSHYQPFAGIYSTYMVPQAEDPEKMIRMLSTAIKSVYASVFYHDSKAYMTATSNVIDEEKMAVVLQEVCGRAHGNRFYPTLSGVARSINFYPIEPEKSEDGIASIALGLGKYIVDGGMSLRFSPKYPKKILQLSTPQMALTETQKIFYALDLDPENFKPSTDDAVNLNKLRIKDAENDDTLQFVASTFDYQDNAVRDGTHYEGKKIITFSNILKYDSLPLAEILTEILTIGHKEMNNPIEIEFALNISNTPDEPHIFNWLQIRPIVDNDERIVENLEKTDPKDTIIYSKTVLGNGIIKDVFDLVYIKTENFNPANNNDCVPIINKLNEKFIAEKKNYILVGPGRWGSSDHWLGVPVKWSHISAARVIVESGLSQYRIDPSQGTHFFQNLTSFRVGYFTINPYSNDGVFDYKYLQNKPAMYEDKYIRHVRFEKPIVIKIDGKKSLGMVMKPED